MSNNWSTFQGGAARTGQTPNASIGTAAAGAPLNSSTPLLTTPFFCPVFAADGTAYYLNNAGTIEALRPDGTVFSTSVEGFPTGLTVAPNGTICYGTTMGLVVLEADLSVKMWYTNDGAALGSVVVDEDGTMYASFAGVTPSSCSTITAITSAGTVRWTCGISSHASGCPFAYRAGQLFAGCPDGTLFGFNTSTGGLAWSTVGNPTLFAPVSGSPAIGSDGTVYLSLADPQGGVLTAWSSTGQKWNYYLHEPMAACSTPVLSSDGTTVYVAGTSIHAVNTATGTGGPISPPISCKGPMVLTSDNYLYVPTFSNGDIGLNGFSIFDVARQTIIVNYSTNASLAPNGALSVSNDGSLYVGMVDSSIWHFYNFHSGSSGGVSTRSAPSDTILYYGVSYPSAIQKLTSSTTTLVDETTSSPNGLAVDPATGDVYWTDGPCLHRSTSSGTEKVAQFPFNLTGLALDLANNRAFSCNASGGLIVSLDFAGNATTLVSGLKLPVSVAVDVSQNLLVWAEYNPGRIQKAGLDGSNVTLVVDDLALSQSVVVDPTTQRIYWADKSSVSGCDYTGQNRSIIVSTNAAQPNSNSRKLAIDTAGGKLYWSDQATQSIQQANTDGSQLSTLVSHADNPSFDNPTVIAVSA